MANRPDIDPADEYRLLSRILTTARPCGRIKVFFAHIQNRSQRANVHRKGLPTLIKSRGDPEERLRPLWNRAFRELSNGWEGGLLIQLFNQPPGASPRLNVLRFFVKAGRKRVPAD